MAEKYCNQSFRSSLLDSNLRPFSAIHRAGASRIGRLTVGAATLTVNAVLGSGMQ